MASDWAKKYNRIVMIAGHYEGVDERIKKVVSDFGFRISDLSIGPYVLTGGELPALVVVDAVSRHIPGFLGKGESLEEKRHGVGVPVYTRPEIFRWKEKVYRVPAVLRSGDHKKIEGWRRGMPGSNTSAYKLLIGGAFTIRLLLLFLLLTRFSLLFFCTFCGFLESLIQSSRKMELPRMFLRFR